MAHIIKQQACDHQTYSKIVQTQALGLLKEMSSFAQPQQILAEPTRLCWIKWTLALK